MRNHLVCVCIALLLACSGLAQQPPTKNPEAGKSSNVSAEAKLKDMFESKVKAEWEALKKKDKNA